MKKTFLLLAMALMGLTANADPTFTITYTPQGGTEQTITEGATHNLGDLHGSITISGSTITFDNVNVEIGAGFVITPSDLNAAYVLDLQFIGYNVISSDLTAAIDIVGNARSIGLHGDALRAYGWAAPALRTQNGYFRAGMLELYAKGSSANFYVIEMGEGEKLDILADESYGRVCLERVHNSLPLLALNPLINGASVIDEQATNGRKFYGTSTMKQTIPASIAGFTLNQGNLPYLTRILPGYKSGTFSVEDKSNREGSFVHFNMKDLEIVTDRQEIFAVTNANLMLNVEGTNNITGGSNILYSVDDFTEHLYGQIEIKGVGQNAELNVTAIDNYLSAVYCENYVRFDNVTSRFVMDPVKDACSQVIFKNYTVADDAYRQFIIKNNAKLLLQQKNVDQYTPGLIYGFTSLGLGLSNTYANPINGTFTNNQFLDQNGSKLHVAYFDNEVYGLVVEGWDVFSLNVNDIMEDGKVSYDAATKTLHLNDAVVETLVVTEPTLNLTASESIFLTINAPELNIVNSTNLSIEEGLHVGKLSFTNSMVEIGCVIDYLTAVPTFSGCHAVEYSEFSLDNTELYGLNGTTPEKVTKLTVVKDGPEGIFNTTDDVRATKTFRDGQLLIQRAGQTYNVQGALVK